MSLIGRSCAVCPSSKRLCPQARRSPFPQSSYSPASDTNRFRSVEKAALRAAEHHKRWQELTHVSFSPCAFSAQLPGVPFDSKRHVVPSLHGRVVSSPPSSSDGSAATPAPVPGLYVSGWLRRGPSGIIATNIMDARDTVKSVVADIANGVIKQPQVRAR